MSVIIRLTALRKIQKMHGHVWADACSGRRISPERETILERIQGMKLAKKLWMAFLMILLCLPLGMPVQAASVNETAAASGQAAASGSGNSQGKNVNGVIHTEDFEIRVMCGLDGNYRSGASIPVTIYIKSVKKDFEGTVRMIVPGNYDYDSEAVAYEKDVLLSTGVQKVVTMSVYSSTGLAAFRFQVENRSGDILINKSVTMKSQSGDEALAGVLSDDYTALNYFDGLSINLSSYAGTIQLVELDEDTFPEQSSGLEALSYLIINSYDTSKFSEAQYAAVKNWVEQGGVLIIGTGSDYSRTLSGFQDDFLEGTIGGPAEGTLQLNAEKSQAMKYTRDQGIVELSLKGGQPLTGILKQSDEKSGLIWNRDYGQGHVVVTAFNLGMEPVVSWGQAAQLAGLLLNKSASGYSSVRIENLNYGSYSADRWVLSEALDILHDSRFPDMKLMGILFLALVILIGPGLYLILKLIDKREWMWILVPVLAVGFTAGIFSITSNLRIRDPREASITTLYYDMESDHGVQEKVDMVVQVPGADKREIDLDPSLVNLKIAGDSYDYYSGYPSTQAQEKQYEYKTAVRETAQGYLLGIRNGQTFGSTYMSMNHMTEDSSPCGLVLEVERNTTGISGKVTNDTGCDLRSVSVYASSVMVMIGDLKAGESAEFTEADNQYLYYDMYNINFTGSGSEDSREYMQQRNIWNLFCTEYLYGMSERDIYTYAYMDKRDTDYITDDKIQENNVAVLVRRDSVDFSDYQDAVILNLYDYCRNPGNGWDSDGQLYVPDIEIEYDLNTLVTDIHALIRAKDEYARYGPTDQVTIYGYNVQTSQFEELFTDSEIMEFEDGCPYLGDNGLIKLKFTCPDVEWRYTPQITVVGGES